MKKLIQIVVLLCACMTASAAKPPPMLYTFYTTNTTFDVNRWVTNIATNMAVIWGGGGGLSQAQVVALITNATVMKSTNADYAVSSVNSTNFFGKQITTATNVTIPMVSGSAHTAIFDFHAGFGSDDRLKLKDWDDQVFIAFNNGIEIYDPNNDTNLSATITAGGVFNGNGSGLTNLNPDFIVVKNAASGPEPLQSTNLATKNYVDASKNGNLAALATNVVSGIQITNPTIRNIHFAGTNNDGSTLAFYSIGPQLVRINDLIGVTANAGALTNVTLSGGSHYGDLTLGAGSWSSGTDLITNVVRSWLDPNGRYYGMNVYAQGDNYDMFSITASNGTTRVLTVNSNGNVGIGTNNPQCALDVRGTGSAGANYSVRFGSPSVTNAFVSYTNGWAGIQGGLQFGGVAGPIIQPSGGSLFIDATSGNEVNLRSGSSIRAKTVASGFDVVGNIYASLIYPTNGIVNTVKGAFFTNYTMNGNETILCPIGTNQVIVLPNPTNFVGKIYRFACTNSLASFTLYCTNTVGSSIRDGSSTSFTQVGIGSPSFFSDGVSFWPAARTKVVMPCASWSTSTNVPLANTVSNLVTYDTLEFNNSQGINLVSGNQLWITNAGTYQIMFSAVTFVGHNGDSIALWLQNNGTNWPRTATYQTMTSAGQTNVMTVSYFVPVSTATYWNLAGKASATGCGLGAYAADTTVPACPSIIVTVNRISDTYP